MPPPPPQPTPAPAPPLSQKVLPPWHSAASPAASHPVAAPEYSSRTACAKTSSSATPPPALTGLAAQRRLAPRSAAAVRQRRADRHCSVPAARRVQKRGSRAVSENSSAARGAQK